MKLLEAMHLVDKSESNKASAGYEALCELFNIECVWQNYGTFENRVSAFYLRKWYCTDTWVGTVVYFLDNKVVAISDQVGRKYPLSFQFINQKVAMEVKNLLLSLAPEDKVDVINPEEEIESFYTVNFCDQLLTKEGIVDGKNCTIIERDSAYLGKEVTVIFGDKTTKTVPLTDFKIPFHLKG